MASYTGWAFTSMLQKVVQSRIMVQSGACILSTNLHSLIYFRKLYAIIFTQLSPFITTHRAISQRTAEEQLGNPEQFKGGCMVTKNGATELFIQTAEDRLDEDQTREAELCPMLKNAFLAISGAFFCL